MSRIWSKYQHAVFFNIANGLGHTVVNAVAGSGKTTTIIEALSHIPKGLTTLFVAFNKLTAEDLKKKAPWGVEVSTLHSYGLKTITNTIGRMRIENHRVDGLMNAMHAQGALEVAKLIAEIKGDKKKGEVAFDLRRDIAKTVSLAKGALAGSEEQIDAIIDAFEIESAMKFTIDGIVLSEKQRDDLRASFIRDVLALLVRCANPGEDGQIDFDDMIWLPVVLDLKQRKFDRVFVDETQDLNACQIEMTMRAVKPGGRICAVGDPRQAIYAFRGADSAAMGNLIEKLEAEVLPLSVCYRCCKAVVREAQKIVPTIEWAENADEGSVSDVTIAEMKIGAGPGDFILSRTNAPLISLCLWFLKEGRPAAIQGRDIGASLAAFVRKSQARSVEELCDYIEGWRDVECQRLAAKHRSTQSVEDRADCILALSEGARHVNDVVTRIEMLFADKDDSLRIMLSTTHKAKGMERDRVWLLRSTYMRSPETEEANLLYVGITRARQELCLVHGDLNKKSRDGQ